MSSKKVVVQIKPKKDILDPQGEAVKGALLALGFTGVSSVLVGKNIEIEIEDSKGKIEEHVDRMCQDLLCNENVEEYSFSVLPN